jgi:hypothetical protein
MDGSLVGASATDMMMSPFLWLAIVDFWTG